MTRAGSAVRHFLEMVVAMAVGMVALGPLWTRAAAGLGWSAWLERPDVAAMVMALNMSIAMSVWMRYRGHSWTGAARMSAGMVAAFAVLLPALWAGALTGAAFMTIGHVLMLVVMAGMVAGTSWWSSTPSATSVGTAAMSPRDSDPRDPGSDGHIAPSRNQP